MDLFHWWLLFVVEQIWAWLNMYITLQHGTVQWSKVQYSKVQYNTLQVAGAGFRVRLLICLLNLTLNEKSSLHSLQFASKYHVSLDSLQPQIREQTHGNLVTAALYYTGVELEKIYETHREQTDRESNYRGHSNPVDRRVERANINCKHFEEIGFN